MKDGVEIWVTKPFLRLLFSLFYKMYEKYNQPANEHIN